MRGPSGLAFSHSASRGRLFFTPAHALHSPHSGLKQTRQAEAEMHFRLQSFAHFLIKPVGNVCLTLYNPL